MLDQITSFLLSVHTVFFSYHHTLYTVYHTTYELREAAKKVILRLTPTPSLLVAGPLK